MQGMPRLLSHDMWRRRERIIRSRRLFLWALACFPSPRFQPDETHWEKDEKRKEGPFPASGKDGSPQKYIFYDVGGTMGSPYIFQVSGR